ncbi:MAG: hypothetical protein ACRECP_04050 [Methylocella sp.]
MTFDRRFDQTLGLAYTVYDHGFTGPNVPSVAPRLYGGQRVKLDALHDGRGLPAGLIRHWQQLPALRRAAS